MQMMISSHWWIVCPVSLALLSMGLLLLLLASHLVTSLTYFNEYFRHKIPFPSVPLHHYLALCDKQTDSEMG